MLLSVYLSWLHGGQVSYRAMKMGGHLAVIQQFVNLAYYFGLWSAVLITYFGKMGLLRVPCRHRHNQVL